MTHELPPHRQLARSVAPLLLACLWASHARAQEATPAPEAPPDTRIGSPLPPSLGDHGAPPVPPAPGGRAPSFGAPSSDAEAPQLHVSGRLNAVQSLGLGRIPAERPEGYGGTPLHVPAYVGPGTQRGAFGLVRATYGTQKVSATIAINFGLNGSEYRNYYNPQSGGVNFAQAYLTLSPDDVGPLRVRAKVGAFSDEYYASPGPFGWGLYGPLMGLRGYGETLSASAMLTSSIRAELSHGFLVVPGLPENYPVGDAFVYLSPTGTSSLGQHAHLKLSSGGPDWNPEYSLNLHFAHLSGYDDRTPAQAVVPTDGHANIYAFDAHYAPHFSNQVGIAGALWDLHRPGAINDVLWWGPDYTQGASQLAATYLGDVGTSGKIFALSAEGGMSVRRMFIEPGFEGGGADITLTVAAMLVRSLASGGQGNRRAWFLASYSALSWLSFNVSANATGRAQDNSNAPAPSVSDGSTASSANGSASVGCSFRTDWYSRTRLSLWYTRQFYGASTDKNRAQPFDRNVFSAGAFVNF